MLHRFFLLALCVLIAGCAVGSAVMMPGTHAGPAATAHRFQFDDGGHALYYVIDVAVSRGHVPRNLMFVIPGSGCASMGPLLPRYFSGLQGASGPTRIFILHKRFIEHRAHGHADSHDCSDAFVDADHPSRWLADQTAFVREQLRMARDNGQPPQRVIAVGISEGAEVVPALARRVPALTHVALFANGGMNPRDTFRLQARRHDFVHEAEQVEALCNAAALERRAAGRSCLYWAETFALDHIGNLLSLSVPVFVAMGDADRFVPPDSATFLARRFEEAGRHNLRLLLIPGADHGLAAGRTSFLPYLWDALDHWVME